MNNSLIYGFAILSITYNCTNVNSQDFAANATAQDSVYVMPTHFSDDLVRDDALYTSLIRVDKQHDDDYVLSVQMNLKKDAHFVSPNAQRAFSGKFTIVLDEPGKIQALGTLIEKPLSIEELDQREGLVNWVRKSTNYRQKLKILSGENFEVRGHVQFTIEPRCTLEKIPFLLSQKDGKLSLKLEGC